VKFSLSCYFIPICLSNAPMLVRRWQNIKFTILSCQVTFLYIDTILYSCHFVIYLCQNNFFCVSMIFAVSSDLLHASNKSLFHTWKPIRTISNILKKPKNKIEKEASRGIVYKIKCKDCDCVYVGQTSRALKTRVKEHAKAIATLDKNSLLAKHHMLNGHQIDLKSVEIVDRSSAWRQRLILEAWHSVRNRNATKRIQ